MSKKVLTVEYLEPVLLWEGSNNGYSGTYTLNDSPLNYKKLLILFSVGSSNWSIEININNGVFYDNTLTTFFSSTYHAFCFTGFSLYGNNLFFNHIHWVNSSNNGGITINKIYGIR